MILIHLPYKPSTNYAHLSIDSENIFGDIIGFSVDYAHNFDDCVNTLNDEENIVVDSINMFNISFIDFSIPNPTLLPLLVICKLKIKTMFTIGSMICSLSSSFLICGFYI